MILAVILQYFLEQIDRRQKVMPMLLSGFSKILLIVYTRAVQPHLFLALRLMATYI